MAYPFDDEELDEDAALAAFIENTAGPLADPGPPPLSPADFDQPLPTDDYLSSDLGVEESLLVDDLDMPPEPPPRDVAPLSRELMETTLGVEQPALHDDFATALQRHPGREPTIRKMEADASTRRYTDGELSLMPAGFQAIATPSERPTLPERAPWGAYGDDAARRAYESGTLREPAPVDAGEGDDGYRHGREIDAWRAGRAAPGRRRPEMFAKAAKALTTDEMTPGQARKTRDQREADRLQLAKDAAERKRLADEAKAGRGRVGSPTGLIVAPPGVELTEAQQSRLDWINKMPPKERRTKGDAFLEDLQNEQIGAGKAKITDEKTAKLQEDFESANPDLQLTTPGQYAQSMSMRGSMQMVKDITAVNRAIHASNAMLDINDAYHNIPIHQRFGSAALRLKAAYELLKKEHQGIILKLGGSGTGGVEERGEITDWVPDIATSPQHFSQAKLRGLHDMLMINGEANLMNYGISLREGHERYSPYKRLLREHGIGGNATPVKRGQFSNPDDVQ